MPNVISPLELHIEVLQGLQKVDGFQQDMFLPEEIDLQLNKQQGRIVEKLTNKEFQRTQIFLDYIKNIIVKNWDMPALTVPTNASDPLLEPGHEPQMVYGVLPTNYLHLISDRSTIYQRLDCAEVEDADLPTETYTERQIRIALATVAEANKYVDVTFTNVSTGEVVFSGAEYLLRGELISSILKNFKDPDHPDARIYWERYRNEYRADQFIIVLPGSGITDTYSLGYDEDPISGGAGSPVSANSNNIGDVTFTQIQQSPAAATYEFKEITENKLVEGDDLYKFRKNKFYKPYKLEPHSTLVDQFLIAYRDKSFIITDLTIDYIRKPREISLVLDQGCELAGEAPRIIVDKTVEYFKLVIENPAYRGIVQDNELRNQT
tara:strand:- start:1008 stop:2141 length:1134 start_codon:yes stop_codon:yes gene_type:complete